MEYTKYISISENNGQSVLTVNDYELFDFLDDFFVGQNLQAAFVSKQFKEDGCELHSFHFDPTHTAQSIHQVLHKIQASEIDRICSLDRLVINS